MNYHGITIGETLESISVAINTQSYPTLDFLFNVALSSIIIAAALVIVVSCYKISKLIS